MTDSNKKRYVYLDKFFQYQESISAKLKKMNNRVDILTYVSMALIIAVSMALYKIFG
jgi:hypothetical protein